MRILYCNKYNFPFSGTEVYLFELMKMMEQRGHQVALFSMHDPRGKPSEYDEFLVPKVDSRTLRAECSDGPSWLPVRFIPGRRAGNSGK